MESQISADQRRVEVCNSPLLFDTYFQNRDCVVVIIDVFRATSAICTAFQNGIEKIKPVVSVEEAKAYQTRGWLAAAERNGQVVEGFEFGNSPFHYSPEVAKGKKLALTTTNGTRAIDAAKEANQVIIGAFLNLKAVVNYLIQQNKDVLLLCAGWKNRFNLEDTLFAGAVVYHLKKQEQFAGLSDSSIAAERIYAQAKGNLNVFLESSSHRNRLARLQLEKDIEYCLMESKINLVPILKNGELVLA